MYPLGSFCHETAPRGCPARTAGHPAGLPLSSLWWWLYSETLPSDPSGVPGRNPEKPQRLGRQSRYPFCTPPLLPRRLRWRPQSPSAFSSAFLLAGASEESDENPDPGPRDARGQPTAPNWGDERIITGQQAHLTNRSDLRARARERVANQN